MSDRIEAEILDVRGEEVDAAVDTPLVVIEGTKGDPGADGITPHIGANGNWYLGENDTNKPSRGETGPQGVPGIYYGTTQPTGAHDMYHAGEYAIYNAKMYRCTADTAYSPADYAAAWEAEN